MKRALAILLLAAGTAFGQIDNPPSSVNIVDATATGRAVLTATNAAAAANAIGLGTTNNVTFSNIMANGTLTVKSLTTTDPVGWALDAVQTGSGGPTTFTLVLPDNANVLRLTNQFPVARVSNGRLGAFYYLINESGGNITISNGNGITVQGGTSLTLGANQAATLVATGPTNASVAARGNLDDVTLGGTANTAPNQTASSGSSLMTRNLVDINPLWSLHSVRIMGAYSFGNSGAGSTAVESFTRGGAYLTSGTNANGYGRASIYRGINANVPFTGSGINFARNISVAVVVGMNTATTNSVYRVIVGGNGGIPEPANSNALTNRGFGVEFAEGSSGWPLPNTKARLFAHNGASYTNSAWTSDFVALFGRQVHVILTSDGAGNVSLYLTNSPIDNSAPSRPPTTPTLTISGGPTSGTASAAYVDLAAVNNSTNAPSAQAAMMFYNGLLQTQ